MSAPKSPSGGAVKDHAPAPSDDTRPSRTKVTTAVVIAAATGLVLGFASGSLSAGEPETRTPGVCHVMAEQATEIFAIWTDLTGAVRQRGDALDPETYAIHDAEVNHLLASLEALGPQYNAVETRCLGDS